MDGPDGVHINPKTTTSQISSENYSQTINPKTTTSQTSSGSVVIKLSCI